MREIRCFISSPGDVGQERLIAVRVIERLQMEFRQRLSLSPIVWEHEPLRASEHFQSQIVPPSQADIVVCILWSRLGTRLPAEFRRPDGSTYESGTEWEFENAIESFRQKGTPDLLVYRKTSEAMASLQSKEQLLQQLAQKEALDHFIDRWFGNPSEGFRAAFHSFASADEFERLLETHLRNFLSSKVGASPVAPGGPAVGTWHRGTPFRGLSPFDVKHADIFFGRTRAIGELKARLQRRAHSGTPFLLVIGMSGSGKSSLVRAGLVPTLTIPGVVEGVGLWRYAIVRPADVSGLDKLLGVALTSESALPNLPEFGFSGLQASELLNSHPGLLIAPLRAALEAYAKDVAKQEKLSEPPSARLLLVIDQLEEVFTSSQATDLERQNFSRALQALVQSGIVWVVATMRSDLYSRLSEAPLLLELKGDDGQYDLLPPTTGEIEQMIQFPARVAGIGFEIDPQSGVGLDKTILEAASKNPEALPLLEFTLDELYKRREKELLSFAAYRQLGGLEGAIAQRAEEVLQGLTSDVQARLPNLFRACIAISPTGDLAPAGLRVPLKPLLKHSADQELIDAFVNARLLVTDRDTSGAETIGFAHEALLRHWPRLTAWLEENLEYLRSRLQVQTAAETWQSSGRNPDFLLSPGKPLAIGESLLAAQDQIAPLVLEFVTASRSKIRRAVRQKFALAITVVSIFLALATLFGIYSFVQWRYAVGLKVAANKQRDEAQKQRDEAQKQRNIAEQQTDLANQQTELAKQQTELALKRESEAEDRRIEAVQAGELAKQQTELAKKRETEAEARRIEAVQAGEREKAALEEERKTRAEKEKALEQVQAALKLADFNLLFRNPSIASSHVLANRVASAEQFLGQTPVELRNWEWNHVSRRCHEESVSLNLSGLVTAIGFSPRGRMLALAVSPEDVGGGEMSPRIEIWDWVKYAKVHELRPLQQPAEHVVMLDKGERAVSISSTELIFWNVDQQSIERRTELANAKLVAIAENGNTAAFAFQRGESNDNASYQLELRDIAKDETLAKWTRNGELGQDICLSTDGTTVAVVEDYCGLTVFQVGSDEPLWTRPQPDGSTATSTVFSMALGPEKTKLAVGDYQGTITLFDLRESSRSVQMTGHENAVAELRFMGEKELISGSWDSTIRIWDTTSAQQKSVLRGHEYWVQQIALSPSQGTLVSTSRDREMKFWDMRKSSHPVQPFPGLGMEIYDLTWSERGRNIIASALILDGSQAGESLISVEIEKGNILNANLGATSFVTQRAGLVAFAGGPEGDVIRLARANNSPLLGITFEGDESLPNIGSRILCGTYTTDNVLAVGTGDGQVLLWDVSDKKELCTLTAAGAVNCLAFHKPTNRIYAGSARKLTMFDLTTQTKQSEIELDGIVKALAIRPGTEELAVAAGYFREPGKIHIYDLNLANLKKTLLGHRDMVTCLDFTPDGSRLASGSFDTSVRIWDVDVGLEAISLWGHRREVNCLSFDAAGNKLASGDRFGTILVWDGSKLPPR